MVLNCVRTVHPNSWTWDSDTVAAPGLHTAWALKFCQLTENSVPAFSQSQISGPVNRQDGCVQSWYQNAGIRTHVFVATRGLPFLSSSLTLGSVLIILLTDFFVHALDLRQYHIYVWVLFFPQSTVDSGVGEGFWEKCWPARWRQQHRTTRDLEMMKEASPHIFQVRGPENQRRGGSPQRHTVSWWPR